ncbi:molybdate ABC transporter ATP-binding protein ModF [Reinekea marinisedimentorum]|uniref:Molybdate transport system ATP-binding protein n=1 Tax=Reinekea marinisedimentorum TaxID=230495 RepID=A0A4R3IAV3_9GAMM|nr:molybdate ABC transporter ATP-binding protein ModF [Reinekea marinisedimentorum]TCS43719.1 molybdate transport system ATP-binding protein [Reinekea marinisedimentorum]
MKLINLNLRLNKQTILNNINWHIQPGECWALLGTNASGKTSLAQIISGELAPSSGEIAGRPVQVAWVSLEAQQHIYERELYRDDTDFMDQLDAGTTVKELMCETAPWSDRHQQLAAALQLTPLLDRGYRLLSSGEGRKLMLANALLSEPELLILDEPFEGLDAASRNELHQVINQLIANGQWLLLMVNQQDDICSGFSQLALLDKGELRFTGAMPNDLAEQWQHLLTLRNKPMPLPARQSQFQLDDWPENKPLVHIENGFVQYDDTYQFQGLNWQLLPGVHSQISGPNGCGKSTLLGLITGDHPQCYRNRMQVFGYQRGQGESIWQIKKHLGYVSGNLHRDYRVAGNALTAVVSGLTDSIGVYKAIGESEKQLALSWLALIGLREKWNTPFRQLSMGEQRLVLMARALIKQPPLLILDEPTQGLDDFNRYYVLNTVERIIANGPTTLLFVSHRQDESLKIINHKLLFTESKAPEVLFDIQTTQPNA